MRKILKTIAGAGTASLVWVSTAFAQPAGSGLDKAKGNLGSAGTPTGLAQTDNLAGIIGNIISIALGFLGVIFLVLMLYGGFKYMTAGGEEKGVKEATTTIKNAAIGLVIILAAYALTSFVMTQMIGAVSGNPVQ